MIIYLHGFNSSPLSGKAADMAQWCGARGVDFVAPALPVSPARAAALVDDIAKANDGAHLFVGSSMGGYYSAHFCEKYPRARAALINPAVDVADKLEEYAGKEMENYHTGEKYIFKPEYIAELRALRAAPAGGDRYMLLAQTGDEVLDWREARDFFKGARQIIEQGGDHSFQNFSNHIPAIVDFGAEFGCCPSPTPPGDNPATED